MAAPTNYQNLDHTYYLPTFKRFPLTLEKGSGSRVWDDEGNEYIDAMAGIAVNSVGHCHPGVVKAIQQQAEQLIHISNFYISKPQVRLAEKLAALSGLQRAFFANSGAEANEGAFKIARKYAHTHGRGGDIIAFSGSFHGRTLATIATGKAAMQKGFEPIPAGFKQVPFNDLEAVKNAVDEHTAAIIIEPVQGEGGINPAGREFMQALRELCDAHNIVLIFDEIQCGMGRTGAWFAKTHYGVEPDILTSAKALGGGVPVSAILVSEKISEAISYGDHGTTFGGNPLATAAALAAIKAIEDENLLEESRKKGEWMQEQIRAHEPRKYGIREVRGLGLMLGIDLDFEAKPVVERMIRHGVLANATADTVLRLVPPLNISYEELQRVLDAMYQSIREVQEEAQ